MSKSGADSSAFRRGVTDGRYWRKLAMSERTYRESAGRSPVSPYNGTELSAEWLAGFVDAAGPTTPRAMAHQAAESSPDGAVK